MALQKSRLAPNYQRILSEFEPYLITFPGNLGALDLAPCGVTIPEQYIFDPTRLRSRDAIDCLHLLDSFTFGDQGMLMPRWVLFDCGEFPGIVFGFGKRARDLPPAVRALYQRAQPEHDDVFVPLSMWVAIPCAEEKAWFGHNLSSANLVSDRAWPGLATITKALGICVTRCTRQYGATQWDSGSIAVHLRLGELNVLCAYTPAHTHPETLAYRIDVEPDRLLACLHAGWQVTRVEGDLVLRADDPSAIRALHAEIEAGASPTLIAVESADPGPQRLTLRY